MYPYINASMELIEECDSKIVYLCIIYPKLCMSNM